MIDCTSSSKFVMLIGFISALEPRRGRWLWPLRPNSLIEVSTEARSADRLGVLSEDGIRPCIIPADRPVTPDATGPIGDLVNSGAFANKWSGSQVTPNRIDVLTTRIVPHAAYNIRHAPRYTHHAACYTRAALCLLYAPTS